MHVMEAGAWTVDVKQWGDALIYTATVSGALFALWKMWVKRIVTWIREQGETNSAVARVVTTELPKMTRAIERVSDTQRDHGRKIEDLDHRVSTIEGGTHQADNATPITAPRRRGQQP